MNEGIDVASYCFVALGCVQITESIKERTAKL